MKLQEWIESEERDYGIGLAILGNHSKNRVLLQNLGRKKNPAKLEYELGKVAKLQGIDWKYLGKVEETAVDEQAEPLPPVEESEGKEQVSTESHSDQVIDQMNAEKTEQLETDAEGIVDEKLSDLEAGADNVVQEKLSELELMAEQVISGKLKIARDGKEISFNELSGEMKARWEQNRDSYKEIRVLHEKLKLMENATPEDRQPLTERIAKLDDLIRDNWKEIDAFVPPVPSAETAPAIDHKRMQANRKYISTNLKKLAEITDTVKKAKIVSELQLRFNEIKTAGETFAQDTLDELAKVGVEC